MRIRLNAEADEMTIEFAGATGQVEDKVAEDAGRSFEIPGDHGRAAFVSIDLDGFVRIVRVARLKDVLEQFAPQASAAKRGRRS